MKPIYTVTLNPAFDLHYRMERFEAGKENYVREILCDAGGKGINTSRALTVNGIPNTAFVALGDENGAAFASELKKQGMEYASFAVPGRIRENITIHPDAGKETRISLDTFSLTAEKLGEIGLALEQKGLRGALISFSGRLPRGVGADLALDFLRGLIAAGAKVIVDSNSFTPADLSRICPWFIKPNEEEVVKFLGRQVCGVVEAAEAARETVLRGVAEEVMVTLGGDGAAWSDGKRKIILKVPALEHPVSTIGAGDSTIAGYLAATAGGASQVDALKLAVAYGTAACMTPGTLPPRAEDVAEVLAQVTAEDV